MELKEYLQVINKLLKLAESKKINVIVKNFKSSADAFLKGNVIAINSDSSIKNIPFILAHELAHGYLHKDKGNTIDDTKHEEYEEQADRAAHMILDLLSMDFMKDYTDML